VLVLVLVRVDACCTGSRSRTRRLRRHRGGATGEDALDSALDEWLEQLSEHLLPGLAPSNVASGERGG
jgi:hypothetical protein